MLYAVDKKYYGLKYDKDYLSDILFKSAPSAIALRVFILNKIYTFEKVIASLAS